MKERIKQLYDQCFVVLEHDTPNTGFDANKFAELIVQECADLCESFGESGDGYTCSAEILEHFGVKE